MKSNGKVVSSRMKLEAIKVLKQELPRFTFIKLIFKFLLKKKKKIWKSIPLPMDKKDHDSRIQLTDAVVLYQILLKMYPKKRAISIVYKVIDRSAMQFLKETIPVIKKEDINNVNENDKLQMLNEIASKFPNADYKIFKLEKNQYLLKITRCRFPELLISLGFPELSKAFCSADIRFFDKHQPVIKASRSSTIASGNDSCDFTFTLLASHEP